MPICAVPLLSSCTLAGSGKNIAASGGQRVYMTIITLPIYTKEQHYGTRITYVAVRSPAGGYYPVVSLPCDLARLCRIRCDTLAVELRMR